MKRILIAAVAALLLIAGNGAASAAEDSGVEVGAKFWFNDWTHDVPGFASITSDTATLFGPAIEAKFENHVFVQASYLFSTSDYSFSDGARFDRQDADVALGYMVTPGFGVLAGYKNSQFNEHELGLKDTVFGPYLGIVGLAHVDYNLSFYGKLDYLFTRFKETGGGGPGSVFEEDSPGWIFEVGVKFGFAREVAGTFGYKYETNEGNDSHVKDTFSGPTFGLLFAF